MSIFKDIQFAFRSMAKTPSFTLTALAALALGIGANTAVFSVINAVLLRPLPYTNPDQLLALFEVSPKVGPFKISAANFNDWRLRQHSFTSLGLFRDTSSVLTMGDFPEKADSAEVSPGALAALGVQPIAGRLFTNEEEQPGADRIVLISYALWQRRFAGAGSTLNSTIQVNGADARIVGIMPENFTLPEVKADLYAPLTITPALLSTQRRGNHNFRGVGRLVPGVTKERAAAELQSIAGQLAQEYSDINRNWGATTIGLREQIAGNVKPTLLLLLAAVCSVLLIACANVANLLIARSGARQKEIAVRSALGAGSWDIARQLLTESVTLSVCGGALGLALAAFGIKGITTLGASFLPVGAEVTLDWTVVGFTFLVSIITGIVFGLAPALTAGRINLNSILRGAGRGSIGGVSQARLRSVLVVAEVALSVLLLTSAALLIRSFSQLRQVDPGFKADHVITAKISLPAKQYPGPELPVFMQKYVERLRQLPGVSSAGVARDVPLTPSNPTLNFEIENRPAASSSEQPIASFRAASSGFAETMGLKLVSGRFLEPGDDSPASNPVAVINEPFAKKYFPNENPLGRHIKAGFDDSPWCTIVGVTGEVRYRGLDQQATPEIYYSYHHVSAAMMNMILPAMTVTARTQGDPMQISGGMRQLLRELTPQLALSDLRTMDDIVSGSVATPRFRSALVLLFALLALILAVIGLYGVIAYSVSQRVNEIGVRMAMGAEAGDITRLILSQGMTMAGIGIFIGLAVAYFAARSMQAMLFGITPFDWPTFVGVPLVIAIVTLAACLAPALRAARIDPLNALRQD